MVNGESLGVKNIRAEILKHGEPGVITNACLNRRMSENLDQWMMAQGLGTAEDYSSSERKATQDLPEQQNNQFD